MKFVLELLDKVDHKDLIIAPGCDMPYDVPPENVIGAFQAIVEPESTRKALENYEAPVLDIQITLPDYGNLEKPLVEVFTIDSAQCAACGYMMSLARTAHEKYNGRVEVVEYKWTVLENMARSKVMGVQHLPCLYINGELKWSSIIPGKDEYFRELDKLLQ